MIEATIEDLAITTRSSRESDGVRRRGCYEDFLYYGNRDASIKIVLTKKGRIFRI
jgi:hypothetical protein